MPKEIDIERPKRELFDQAALRSNNRQLVAFVSGLEFGHPTEALTPELLLRFFRGELGGVNEQRLSS